MTLLAALVETLTLPFEFVRPGEYGSSQGVLHSQRVKDALRRGDAPKLWTLGSPKSRKKWKKAAIGGPASFYVRAHGPKRKFLAVSTNLIVCGTEGAIKKHEHQKSSFSPSCKMHAALVLVTRAPIQRLDSGKQRHGGLQQ